MERDIKQPLVVLARMDYLNARIIDVERPARNHALLRFSCERPFAGDPGQFAMVRGNWGADPILPRAFSLVEVGDIGAIFVRAIGKGTELLVQMRKGDQLFVLGPIGRGFSEPGDQIEPILVAGGVGVAPLLFLAERLFQKGKKATFIYGARTADALFFGERIAAAADLVTVTEDGSAGEQGVVTEPLERIVGASKKAQIFACGPESMLKAVAAIAAKRGCYCEVALESRMACGMGVCKGCAVPAAGGDYRYVCSDGPVFRSEEIYGG